MAILSQNITPFLKKNEKKMMVMVVWFAKMLICCTSYFCQKNLLVNEMSKVVKP